MLSGSDQTSDLKFSYMGSNQRHQVNTVFPYAAQFPALLKSSNRQPSDLSFRLSRVRDSKLLIESSRNRSNQNYRSSDLTIFILLVGLTVYLVITTSAAFIFIFLSENPKTINTTIQQLTKSKSVYPVV